jgi:PIN domain nuclease of toxin-antitoxin system
VRLLLDTHVFIWYLLDDPRLPPRWRSELQNSANTVFLSVVSTWEACLKHHLGKLPLPDDPATLFPLQREAHLIEPLPLTDGCLRHLRDLPAIHNDPFDRVRICQAIEQSCRLVTDDASILLYPDVPTLQP